MCDTAASNRESTGSDFTNTGGLASDGVTASETPTGHGSDELTAPNLATPFPYFSTFSTKERNARAPVSGSHPCLRRSSDSASPEPGTTTCVTF